MPDSLGDRMKEYENIFRYKLMKKLPVIARIDGRAFHTYTRNCNKPFDVGIINTMWQTAKHLCNIIDGAKIAFVQSDEISILILDTDSIRTESWFDYNIQKLASVISSEATVAFNKHTKIDNNATFDCRVFNLSPEEVINYFIWRQQDWTRNSIQMLAQSNFSQKELNGKNNIILQEMLFQKGINWNDLPYYLKRGTCIIKEYYNSPNRSYWTVDPSTPIFTENRNYINKYINSYR